MECNESLQTLRTLSKFGAQRYVLVGYSAALHDVFCKACAPLQDGSHGRALSYGRHFASAVQATARSPSVPPRRFTAPRPGAPAAKAPAMPAAASAAQAPAVPAAASAAPAMPVAASAAKAPAVPVAAAPAAHAPAVPVAASAAKGPAEPVAVAPPAQAPAMPAAASAAKAAAVPVAAAPAPAPAATAESATGGTGAARVWRGGGAGPASPPAKAPSAAEAPAAVAWQDEPHAKAAQEPAGAKAAQAPWEEAPRREPGPNPRWTDWSSGPEGEWVHQGFAPSVLRNTQLCKFYFAKDGNQCRRPTTCTFSHSVDGLQIPQAPLAKARTDYPRMYFAGGGTALSTTSLLRDVVEGALDPQVPQDFANIVKAAPREPPPLVPDTPWTYVPARATTPPRTTTPTPLRPASPRRATPRRPASPRKASPQRASAATQPPSPRASAPKRKCSPLRQSTTEWLSGAWSTASSSTAAPTAKPEAKPPQPPPPVEPKPAPRTHWVPREPLLSGPDMAPSVYSVVAEEDV